MADDLAPHPLVVQIGIGLSSSGDAAFKEAVEALAAVKPGEQPEAARLEGAPSPEVLDDDAAAIAEKAALAAQVLAQFDLRELSLFAGYLGPHVQRDDGREWRLLFVDARLGQWLLFPSDRVVAESRQPEPSAAFGKRDVVWVRDDAPVIRGHTPQTVEGRFLSGEFTRAAEVKSGTGGPPEGGATGLFCEATTPFCCIGSRSRR